ncbi:hypothetical protein XH99_06580, partial [Bradyrhizobium nanningense]
MIEFAMLARGFGSCIRKPAAEEVGAVHLNTRIACWLSIMVTSDVAIDSSNRHANAFKISIE